MIFLIILGIILLIIAVLLFSPVNISISFKEDFAVKVKFLGIKLFDSLSDKGEKKIEEKKKEEQNKSSGETVKKAKSVFSKLKDKYGFSMAIKELISFFMKCFAHIKGLLRHIKIKKIRLNIAVATPDAAKTAIEYGVVCSAVYPALAVIDTIPNICFKEINVKSDFKSEEGGIDFSFDTKLQVFFALICAFKIYKEYKNFIIRIEDNERE